MKHLKKFETNESYFKIGDYVRTHYNINIDDNKFFKIMSINVINRIKNKNAYSAEDIYGNRHHLNDDNIKRKMTKKEINEFEINKNRIKYNL